MHSFLWTHTKVSAILSILTRYVRGYWEKHLSGVTIKTFTKYLNLLRKAMLLNKTPYELV